MLLFSGLLCIQNVFIFFLTEYGNPWESNPWHICSLAPCSPVHATQMLPFDLQERNRHRTTQSIPLISTMHCTLAVITYFCRHFQQRAKGWGKRPQKWRHWVSFHWRECELSFENARRFSLPDFLCWIIMTAKWQWLSFLLSFDRPFCEHFNQRKRKYDKSRK